MILEIAAYIFFGAFFLIFALVVLFDVLKARKHNQKYHVRKTITAFLFLLPAVILAFFFILLPILFSLGYAFTDAYLLKLDKGFNFVGFKQFEDVFKELSKGKSPLMYAVKNTALFVVLVVPIQIGLALGLALFCSVKLKGRTFFKVCFFVPVAVSLSVTAYLWLYLLDSSSTGMVNSLLGLFGIAPKEYLRDQGVTMVSIVIVSAWQGCGFQMLIFISALSGIRKDLYEAARMDGCNAIQRFFRVTLPGLKPTMIYVLITVFVGACRIIIQPWIMVGPQDNAITISYYMYIEGKEYGLIGYSSAIALLMTLIIGTITFIQRKLLGGSKN